MTLAIGDFVRLQERIRRVERPGLLEFYNPIKKDRSFKVVDLSPDWVYIAVELPSEWEIPQIRVCGFSYDSVEKVDS